MMKASEARENSINNISDKIKIMLLAAEMSIKEAVVKGCYSCWCYAYLNKQAITHLETLGYQVKDCSSQRDGDMFEIKW